MKKSTKVWLGIATIWPVLYVFIFVALIIGFAVFASTVTGHPGSEPAALTSILVPVGFMGLMAVHLFTILEMLAMKVYYIVRVIKTDQLDQNLKIMWTLLLVFATIFAEPVFWYLYIWRDPPLTANNPPQLRSPAEYAGWGQQTSTSDREGAYVPPMQPPDWR